MKVNLYTIFDTMADEAGPIYQAKNDRVASRQFKNALSEIVTETEYCLYRLGTYDTEQMSIETLKTPFEINIAREVKTDE